MELMTWGLGYDQNYTTPNIAPPLNILLKQTSTNSLKKQSIELDKA
jgi:hypothetical protein